MYPFTPRPRMTLFNRDLGHVMGERISTRLCWAKGWWPSTFWTSSSVKPRPRASGETALNQSSTQDCADKPQ